MIEKICWSGAESLCKTHIQIRLLRFCFTSFLGNSQSHSKMGCQSKTGAVLGPLPRHMWSVELFLSFTTGLISLQFYLVFDDFFDTIQFNCTKNCYLWHGRTLLGLSMRTNSKAREDEGWKTAAGASDAVCIYLTVSLQTILMSLIFP